MSALISTLLPDAECINAFSRWAAPAGSRGLADALGTRSATASPRLVIVKLRPCLTCRSSSGSVLLAS
jgi:hypothetical protein